MFRVPEVLAELLDAQVTREEADARVAGLRAALDDVARFRWLHEGAAPSWVAPRAGVVRFDPPGDWHGAVSDAAAYGSWVAEHYPTEAAGVVHVPAAHLEAALEALRFAGVPVDAAEVETREAFRERHLAALVVEADEAEDEWTFIDGTLGVEVPGLAPTRDAGGLVVSLAKGGKREAMEAGRDRAEAFVRALTDRSEGVEDAPQVARETIATRIAGLVLLPGAHLKDLARDLDLTRSGTKDELAERIARAEAVAGLLPVVPAGDVVQLDPNGLATMPLELEEVPPALESLEVEGVLAEDEEPIDAPVVAAFEASGGSVACPECGARENEECSTLTGRDHRARQRAEAHARGMSLGAPPAEEATPGTAIAPAFVESARRHLERGTELSLPNRVAGLKRLALELRLPVGGTKADLEARCREELLRRAAPVEVPA